MTKGVSRPECFDPVFQNGGTIVLAFCPSSYWKSGLMPFGTVSRWMRERQLALSMSRDSPAKLRKALEYISRKGPVIRSFRDGP
jgi:hypothetical protein